MKDDIGIDFEDIDFDFKIDESFIENYNVDVAELVPTGFGARPEVREPEREVKQHRLMESKITELDELNSRSRVTAYTNSAGIRDTDEELSRYKPNIDNKKDLVLKSKRKNVPKVVIGRSLGENTKSNKEDGLEIGETMRKDLVLSKSKFSEKKEDTYSWSMQALGKNGQTVGTNKKIKNNSKGAVSQSDVQMQTSTKEKKKGIPLKLQLVLSAVFLIVIVTAVKYSSSGTKLSRIDGKDMYPTLSASKFYKLNDITDYNSLNYFDIVVLEINGVSIASRIVGFPGDSVEVQRDGIYLNGNKLDTSIVGEYDYTNIIRESPDTYKYSDGTIDYLNFRLEAGSNLVFVLGDNRSNARDSLLFGPIDVTYIKYKVE